MQTEVLIITNRKSKVNDLSTLLEHRKNLRIQRLLEPALNTKKISGNSLLILDLKSIDKVHRLIEMAAKPENISSIICIVSPYARTTMKQIIGKVNALVSDTGILTEINLAIDVCLQGGLYISPHLVDDFIHSNDTSETDIRILTKTEMKVLKAASRGLTNKQLASQLYVSPNTIHSHCRNIYKKLGVRGRVEAINVVFGGVG